MELHTQTHLTNLRNLLNYRLRELRADVHAAEQAQREASLVGGHEVSDRKDEAGQRLLADVDGAHEQREVDELAETEAALHRLDLGTYGDCLDCGEAIPLERLLVQPAALRCAPCQADHEHALDRAGAG
jgi:RNA polymerase-binding transcription factor DksA